ncbi:hypothetical protein ACGFZK_06685 [Streptomyces sp. NPDC048257]|uniref:hypothetical protein n=1 Tax=Streptomyces sp. NPDC048257 TaxID=3365526 RepID=UPI0037150540
MPRAGRSGREGRTGQVGRAILRSRRAVRTETDAGLARLEGYLLSERLRREGAEAGCAFAGRLSWLGPDEQAEVARHFARAHLHLRRQMLTETADRARELRDEYGRRYAALRLRLVGLSLSTAGVAVSAGWFLTR